LPGVLPTCDWSQTESCRNCPQDCGACNWVAVRSDIGDNAVAALPFEAVWGSANTDVFAVGWHGSIAHFDGQRWVPMASGVVGDLLAVWGRAAGDVVAAGRDRVVRYEGNSWWPVGVAPEGLWWGVWIAPSDDIVVAGTAGVWEYDGSEWKDLGAPEATYTGIWGTEANLFAVGTEGAIVRRRSSGSWETLDSGTTADLHAVWGASASDIFAVGAGGIILRYDGSGWTAVPSGTTVNLVAVHGRSATEVYAAGGNTVLRFDGTSWAPSAAPPPKASLRGVWAGASEALFGAGYGVNGGGALLSRAGSSEPWKVVETPAPTIIEAVWGSSASDIFAVGQRGIIVHYDGSRWQRMEHPAKSENFSGVWGASPQDVYVVGRRATLHYDGKEWTRMPGVTDYHAAVWGSSPNNVYAVGFPGIDRFDGKSWTHVYTAQHTLLAVWGASASDVFAVGESGLIVHFDGTRWSPMSSGVSERLSGVWGRGGQEVYAVGDVAVRYDGSRWMVMAGAIPDDGLLSAIGVSGGDLFATTVPTWTFQGLLNGGELVRYEPDDGWLPVRADFRANQLGDCPRFLRLGSTQSGDVLAAGLPGAVVRYCGGGGCDVP
jgi:hypothetical protein